MIADVAGKRTGGAADGHFKPACAVAREDVPLDELVLGWSLCAHSLMGGFTGGAGGIRSAAEIYVREWA